MTVCLSSPRLAALLGISLLGACAATSPSAPPPAEVLLVVNSTEASLSIVPVENLAGAVKVPLGGTNPTPIGVSARNQIALVPMGLDNSVAVIDLGKGQVVRTIPLPANSGATGSAIVDDSLAYVANPNLNTITRVNYRTGDTASVAVGVFPQGIVYTRGKVFVLNGNLVNFAPAGPSWITVVDPVTNAKATGTDSIALADNPGNAGFGAVGNDGELYVVSTGSYTQPQGRLSIIRPVDRVEDLSVAGWGTAPGNVAAGVGDTIYLSSYSEGIMAFDIAKRVVVRGAGNGIPLPLNAAVEVDAERRVYGASTGPCSGGVPGTIHVFRGDLSAITSFPVGECPVGLAITRIPPP
jgi:hypothetical protein